MRRADKSIVPGSNRHYLKLALAKASPPEHNPVLRVSRIESMQEQLKCLADLKSKIQHLEECVIQSLNT